jgi:metallo-beta-lactamase family protein
VVLTHAHLDHTGRLPLLTKLDYNGPVYATPATIELTDLVLRDSAHLQGADMERENRRRGRLGQPPVEVLYTAQHVESLRPLYKSVGYDRHTGVAPGITIRAVEAGHMLGSASLEMTVEENGRKTEELGHLGGRK